MAITLTETAAQRVKTYLHRGEASGDKAQGLRLGVRKTGCSGWAYVVDVAKKIEPEDQVFENQGVRIVVNSDSLAFLDGTEVDFCKQGLNETFTFNNPNVKDECGCGESFNV